MPSRQLSKPSTKKNRMLKEKYIPKEKTCMHTASSLFNSTSVLIPGREIMLLKTSNTSLQSENIII
jgi:hypothetical protein